MFKIKENALLTKNRIRRKDFSLLEVESNFRNLIKPTFIQVLLIKIWLFMKLFVYFLNYRQLSDHSGIKLEIITEKELEKLRVFAD